MSTITTTESERRIEVANIIKDQIGIMVCLSLGAREYLALEDGLRFTAGRNRKIEITLVCDLYNIRVIRPVRGTYEWVEIASAERVYCDQLRDVLLDLADGSL